MDPVELWLQDLESGKYAQVQGRLCRLDASDLPIGWCCLGRACEVYITAVPSVPVVTSTIGPISCDLMERVRTYNGMDMTLPPKVQDWLGLRTPQGDFKLTPAVREILETRGVILSEKEETGELNLAELNDSHGVSFSVIAAVIRSRPPGLFKEVE